jgi:hypothetical protein
MSIEIIGMACEFPGAHSPEELWENVLSGRRFFHRAPKVRPPSECFNADTAACIAGAVAEAACGLPDSVATVARRFLTEDLLVLMRFETAVQQRK